MLFIHNNSVFGDICRFLAEYFEDIHNFVLVVCISVYVSNFHFSNLNIYSGIYDDVFQSKKDYVIYIINYHLLSLS